MNGVLADLGLEQHPDKTTIGPVARGFDFLGYTYSAAGLGEGKRICPRLCGQGWLVSK